MKVFDDNLTTCTADVYNIEGTLYLYRSANETLIGWDSENVGDPGSPQNVISYFAEGACLSSTWQDNAYLDYAYSSFETGGPHGHTHWYGPYWIRC